MATKQKQQPLKWGKASKAHKYHIYQGTTSLCGYWEDDAGETELGEDASFTNNIDCQECAIQAGLIEEKE